MKFLLKNGRGWSGYRNRLHQDTCWRRHLARYKKYSLQPYAFTIVMHGRAEIFVHFGIDTVKLEGAGFERLVEEGDEVEVGTPLIKFDYEYVKANTKSVISPVIISNYEDYAVMEKKYGEAEAGKLKY